MKQYRSLFAVVAVAVASLAIAGCSSFKPTPTGQCPQITVDMFAGGAFGGSIAALDNGCPSVLLEKISSNITTAIATGQFNANLIDIAVQNSGGAQWGQYLAGVSLLFGQEFNQLVNSNLNASVCAVPCAQAVVLGINTALLTVPHAAAAPGVKATVVTKQQALGVLQAGVAKLNRK